MLAAYVQEAPMPQGAFSRFFSASPKLKYDFTFSPLTHVLRCHGQETSTSANNPVILKIEELEKEYGQQVMPYAVGRDFYLAFFKRITDGGLNFNTASNYIGRIRSAISWGTDYGVRVDPSYKDNLKLPHENTPLIALTAQEVYDIYSFDFNSIPRTEVVTKSVRKNVRVRIGRGKYITKEIEYKTAVEQKIRRMDQRLETLEKVRDLFVLQCMLYQRQSDMARLSPDKFDDVAHASVFRTIQQKTGHKAIVKVSKMCMYPKIARELIAKYNGCSPFPKDVSWYNKNLHDLFSIIHTPSLDSYEVVENKIDGVMRTEKFRRGDCISSHTARRTAATWAYTNGIPLPEIMQATGHIKMDTLLTYIKLGLDD